ncbi:MAG: hypothetical protein KDA61_05720 [Planctomycetales bacterium]|nr:hypothetical protein [Planctomycetales bacterium]
MPLYSSMRRLAGRLARHNARVRRPKRVRICIEPLESRTLLAVNPGVTVVTHGFQADGAFADWVVAMGQAILDRADGELTDRSTGTLLKHDPSSGQWQPLPGEVWNNSYRMDEPVVLLYDWADESNDLDDGWLEAGADALFASLVAENNYLPGDLAATSFLEAALHAGGDVGTLDLHFIGHSRGAVLNSRTVARFDAAFDLTIAQVTTLDPHPASPMNDPGYVADNPNANSGVFTYDNVLFADNYFRQDGSYEPLNFDFNGVHAEGAYNLQIPEAVLVNGGSSLEHSDVHTWYYGTITSTLPEDYTGYSGATRNNDADVAVESAWYGVEAIGSRETVGYALSDVGGGDRTGLPVEGSAIDAPAFDAVFNGDFELGNSTFDDEIPGWERHGGNSAAGYGLSFSENFIELNAGASDSVLRHNLHFFPLHASSVIYDYWISDNDVFFPNDYLQVLVDGEVIDQISLASETNGFVRNRSASIDWQHTGFVGAVTFRIFDQGNDGIDSAVQIDNVRLAFNLPEPSPDLNADGRIDGTDFLTWQTAWRPYDGSGPTNGDADFDGDVQRDDLAIWEAAWDSDAQQPSAASPIAFVNSVPERESGRTPQRRAGWREPFASWTPRAGDH